MFNLLFPTLFFIVNNVGQAENGISSEQLLQQLTWYWGYIVIVSVSNLIILNVFSQKERGIFLEYSLIAGSKKRVFYALSLLQLGMILGELIIFNIVVKFIFPVVAVIELVQITLWALLLTIPIIAGVSVLLLFEMRAQTFSILSTVLIFLLFYLADIKGTGLLLLNPLKFLQVGLISRQNWPSLLGIAFLYFAIGQISLNKLDPKPRYR